jgi:hypothetical protein
VRTKLLKQGAISQTVWWCNYNNEQLIQDSSVYRPEGWYSTNVLKVSFSHFWTGFKPDTCLFTRILEERMNLQVQVVRSVQKADLSFFSTFPFSGRLDKSVKYAKGQIFNEAWWDYLDRENYGFSEVEMSKARRAIWFTPENLRPPSYLGHYTLSFDPSDVDQKNLYFPFLFWRINWGFQADETLHELTPKSLVTYREEVARPRKACAFSRSKEPRRMSLYRLISTVMPLSIFGDVSNNPVKDKFRESRQFGFQVCPENSLFPGYVTEKLAEAWLAENVPIWYGMDAHGMFNPDAIVDVTKLTSFEVTEKLTQISNEETEWRRAQPLLREEPSLEPLITFLKHVLM